ncbi:AraC family transcriptional regulator [Methylobacterium nigriterrae]|uniref:AraC family transcriptional regulator n=1 Tax=Methylobacterium nigriterrae TaxID=3127512 RepID=UPI003013BAED
MASRDASASSCDVSGLPAPPALTDERTHAAAAALIPLGLVEAACAVFAGLDVDPARLLAEAGLAQWQPRRRNGAVSCAAFGRLITLGAERAHCPHLGLLVGQQVAANALGPVGCLMRNSETVGDALRALELHDWAWSCGAAVRLCVEDDMALLGYFPYQPGASGTGLKSEGALATVTNVLRALCGAGWSPSEVLLPRSMPEQTDPYRRFFGAPVRFDQGMAAIVFPTRLLKRGIEGADPDTRHAAEMQIRQLEAVALPRLVDELRQLLRTEIIQGRWAGKAVASHLAMHRRTLSRRLRAEGTSFRLLAVETRFEIAKQLLADTNISLVQVSATLDFSEPAAFTHAFRRWSGTTPSAWRRANQAP